MSDPTGPIEAAKAEGAAVDELWSAAYGELKALARSRLRRSGPHTLLDTTSLVNNAYLRLADNARLRGANRGEFFAYCGRVMRSVIVDLIREASAERHGGDAVHVMLTTGIVASAPNSQEPVQVDEALEELERIEPRLARVVEMRYFCGMTEGEIGGALNISERTVRRDWEKARLLLRAILSQ